MKRIHETQALMTEINITPFTDVILVLLIIFMVAAPLIAQSNIEVKLPQASTKDKYNDSKPAYISITSEGVVYFDNKVITNKELKQEINSLLIKDQDLKFIVAADQACRFQEVIRVIDTLKESGVKSLNIATRSSN